LFERPPNFLEEHRTVLGQFGVSRVWKVDRLYMAEQIRAWEKISGVIASKAEMEFISEANSGVFVQLGQ
jgi:hypothetical protein